MKLCMGCMENIDDNIATCPHCGYNEKTLRQESYYLSPGTIVGKKYIVGRVLNYGGYTVSYLGMDAETNRKVIVKEYLPSDFSTRAEGETEVTIYSGDAEEQFNQGLTTFLNEANRIQHLDSDNIQGIARVYDCLAENDTGYVISEYLEGRTLKEILDQGKRYTPQEAREFVCQILTGLCQVHPLDIIHCDIAPETIMVTNTGEIKLLDFGATRYVTTANSKSLAIILKQGYAPEEQYRSKGVRGPWTDVYALGAVMYRMITGKVPEESVDRALVDELKEPSKLGIDIPENMENALMNALNVYQNERTQSAADFLRELRATQVKRIQVKKRKNDTGKFPVWAKGLVAGLLCLALAGGVTAYLMWPEAESQGTDQVPKMINLKDKTIEEARDAIEEENYDEYGITVNVKAVENDFVYDSDRNKNGRICEQVCSGNVNVSDELEKNHRYDVVCTMYSNEKIHYYDLYNGTGKTNAKVMASTMNLDSKLVPVSIDTEGNGYNYWQLDCIKLRPGNKLKGSNEISEKDLKDRDNEVIFVAEIEEIRYYATKFFYWKNLPDFKEEIEKKGTDEYTLYQYGKDGTKLVQTKDKKHLLNSSIVDRNYYSFTKEANEILDQNIDPGTLYNEAEGNDEYVLKVVNEKLPGINSSVQTVCDKLSGLIQKGPKKIKVMVNGTELDYTGRYNAGNQSAYIVQEIKQEKNGQEVGYFSIGGKDEYTITINAKPEPTEAPEPSVTSQPSVWPTRSKPPKSIMRDKRSIYS